jgi:primosomal protein N' (replication factor Y)
VVTHSNENVAQESAERLAKLFLERATPPLALEGPAPAPLYRLKGRYRWQLLAKGLDPGALHQWVREATELLPPSERAKVEVDVDPVDLC